MKRVIFTIALCTIVSHAYGALTVSSSAFKNGELIPCVYACDGENTSPPISWTPGPKNTVSYVLIYDDPDAPGGTFVHWIVYNIPVGTINLPEGFGKMGKTKLEPSNIKQGSNSRSRIDYAGPCPPSGEEHRYFFKIYAVNKMLNFGAKKENDIKINDVLDAIRDATLDQGELMGRYARKSCPKAG